MIPCLVDGRVTVQPDFRWLMLISEAKQALRSLTYRWKRGRGLCIKNSPGVVSPTLPWSLSSPAKDDKHYNRPYPILKLCQLSLICNLFAEEPCSKGSLFQCVLDLLRFPCRIFQIEKRWIELLIDFFRVNCVKESLPCVSLSRLAEF